VPVVFFIIECGIARFLCSKFRHHPHPLHYLCPNFVSFAAFIAEVAHGEKLHSQSINQSPSLFDAPRTEQLAPRNSKYAISTVTCASNKIQQKHVYETVNTSHKGGDNSIKLQSADLVFHF